MTTDMRIYVGEITVSDDTVADDQKPLNGNELKPVSDGRYYYQPNPLWGSRNKSLAR